MDKNHVRQRWHRWTGKQPLRILFSAVLFCGAFAFGGASEPSKKEEIDWGKELNHVRFGTFQKMPESVSGGQTDVAVFFENLGSERVEVEMSDTPPLTDYVIKIISCPSGKDEKTLLGGHRLLDGSTKWASFLPQKRYHHLLHLSALYDLSIPGMYKIQLGLIIHRPLDNGSEFTVWSDAFEIKINDANYERWTETDSADSKEATK